VDIVIAIYVKQAGSHATRDKWRLATNRTEGADRTAHPSRHHGRRSLHEPAAFAHRLVFAHCRGSLSCDVSWSARDWNVSPCLRSQMVGSWSSFWLRARLSAS